MKLSRFTFLAFLSALVLFPISEAAAEEYYKVKPVYIPYPQPGKNWNIRQYGPVGIGINLINPAFTIQIASIEQGSPAEATGKLKKGQIIESINGQTLKDIDPRVQLADILTEAEATDGKMNLKIKDLGVVTVQIPVMGRYSSTWPLNCPKSDKIVRNLGDYLAKLEKPDWSAGPFLLSTGEEKDLETYTRWIKQEPFTHSYPWYIGYRGTAVCEYYLRTGDASVLPAISKMADTLKGSMYNGSWMGRGSTTPNFGYMAGGHMNAAGVHALNFLLLAKECGAEVDDYLLQRVLKQFFRFAGRGNVAYGDQLPEGGFRDNGKTAGLAVAMSSAASLDPLGEDSIYAKVRDNSAMKSFYATTWFNRAHTGGGIGEIWHGVAMQLMVDKKHLQHRSFMDERRWFYEIARRWNGTFSISDSGGSYDKPEWGNFFVLAYTAPRKKLRMFGAPKTQFCKTYPLPKRPWGNAADDTFYSMIPGEFKPGKRLDVSKETIPKSASGPMLNYLTPEASDDVFLMLANHPEYAFRSATARAVVNQERYHLIVPFLKSKDPRVREAGALTICGMFKGKPIPVEKVTDEMYGLIVGMINNPEESWWGTFAAMKGLARLPEEKILPHVDRLLQFLKMNDWWMQSAALTALTKVATDESVYQKVLPAIAQTAAKNTAACLLGSARDLPGKLASSKPEVQKLASTVFIKAYNDIPDPLIAPGGANLASGMMSFKRTVASWIKAAPGGVETMMKMPKLSSAWQDSRKDSDKYVYKGFTPDQVFVGKWGTVDQAKSVEDYKATLAKEAAERAKTAAAKKAGKKIQKKPQPKKKKFTLSSLDIQDDGTAAIGRSKLRWSGNVIVRSDDVLKMSIETIDGQEYLFLEAGGFSASHPADWKCSYYIMKRKK